MCNTCNQFYLFADDLISGFPGSLGTTAGRTLWADSRQFADAQFRKTSSRFDYPRLQALARDIIPDIPENAKHLTRAQMKRVRALTVPAVKSLTESWTRGLALRSAVAFMTGATQYENSFDDGVTAQFADRRVSGVYMGPIPRKVAQLAARPARTRAVGMDAVTLDRLDRTIERAMISGRTSGVGEVGRAVRKEFASMSTKRSRLIATTEMNFSMSRGTFTRAASLGSKKKQWITVGDNRVDWPDCGVNESLSGRGIPLRDAFNSGHMTTPAHPRCRCVIAYFDADPKKVSERFTRESRSSWLSSLPFNLFVMAAIVEGTKHGDPGHVQEPVGVR